MNPIFRKTAFPGRIGNHAGSGLPEPTVAVSGNKPINCISDKPWYPLEYKEQRPWPTKFGQNL